MGKCSINPKAYQKYISHQWKDTWDPGNIGQSLNQAGDLSAPQPKVLSSRPTHDSCIWGQRVREIENNHAHSGPRSSLFCALSAVLPTCTWLHVTTHPTHNCSVTLLSLCHTLHILASSAFFSPLYWPAFLFYHSIPRLACTAQLLFVNWIKKLINEWQYVSGNLRYQVGKWCTQGAIWLYRLLSSSQWKETSWSLLHQPWTWAFP